MGSPGGTSGKEPACQCRTCKRHGFDPWVRKIPWRRAWQPTPVFLPKESHGLRSLRGRVRCNLAHKHTGKLRMLLIKVTYKQQISYKQKSHGRRSVVGYSPWGRKESDMTERLHFHFHHQTVSFGYFYHSGVLKEFLVSAMLRKKSSRDSEPWE